MRAGMTATAKVREFTSLRTDCRMRRVLRMVPKSTMQPQMANAYESNHTSRALEMGKTQDVSILNLKTQNHHARELRLMLQMISLPCDFVEGAQNEDEVNGDAAN